MVSCSLDKSIIIWELVRTLNKQNENIIKARIVRRIQNTKFYQEIIITANRFICRKGNPGNEIKIVKFSNLKTELTGELLSDEFQKECLATHMKSADREKGQPKVHHIDKVDDTIMEMTVSPCQNFLLLMT